MRIWLNEKIPLWWWSQTRLMREEVEIKRIDFKGTNPPHARSLGHLASFHLTCRPVWSHLFNLPVPRTDVPAGTLWSLALQLAPSLALTRCWRHIPSPGGCVGCRAFCCLLPRGAAATFSHVCAIPCLLPRRLITYACFSPVTLVKSV